MDFYQLSLGLLVAANTGLLWAQYRSKSGDGKAASDRNSLSSVSTRNFHLTFFIPYTMAVAADWLQGPHIYAIYKYEKNLPEKIVAALYATGFAAGGISASFAGTFADRFGRKRACLLYCALYFLTCVTMVSQNLTVLFLGRVAGGVSTTLLFSVFEAWMISDYHERGLHIPSVDPDAAADAAAAVAASAPWDKGGAEVDVREGEAGDADWDRKSAETAAAESSSPLDGIFSTMTTLSCVVAIASGVVGDMLVAASGTRTWPFMAAMFCSVMAAAFIATSWRENYGSTSWSNQSHSQPSSTSRRFTFLRDPKILALGLTTCVFEGTMYLFIFFWSAALKNARDMAWNASAATAELPFGLIFSSFMCTMLAGSAIFGRLRSRGSSSAAILQGVVVVVSCCLGITVSVYDERLLFLAFCVIEGCIGVYFPAMASLKSQMVDDDIRGRVYSVLRAPLNVFVVVAHCLDEEGSIHRNNVFLTCAGLLLVVFMVAQRHFPK